MPPTEARSPVRVVSGSSSSRLGPSRSRSQSPDGSGGMLTWLKYTTPGTTLVPKPSMFLPFLMRLPLTQQVLYSSQLAPRAAQVRVHFHGLAEESLLAVLVTGK